MKYLGGILYFFIVVIVAIAYVVRFLNHLDE